MAEFGISLAVGVIIILLLISIGMIIHALRLLDHLEGFIVSVFLAAVAVGTFWAIGDIARSIWSYIK